MNSRLHRIVNWPHLAQEANGSVKKLAKSLHVSVRTLERFFLTEKSQYPHSWLAEERQGRGMVMLSYGLSVKETAAQLGYEHATQFSREFKVHWGHSPTQKRL
jgi:transcriptional regulator GlxA family with amidase domain